MQEASKISIDLLRVGLPLLQYHKGDENAPPVDIAGTCFPIGRNYFMTAAHVLDGLTDDNVDTLIGVLTQDGINYIPIEIRDQETLQTDIAVLHAPSVADYGSLIAELQWYEPSFWAGTPLMAPGYGSGMIRTEEVSRPTLRIHHGHVVSSIREFLPLGASGSPFHAIEVTFQVPRRHSGAPLILAGGEFGGRIAGVVIGTSASESVAYVMREEVNKHSKTVYERTETYFTGIAIPTMTILDLRSELLGGTIREHLQAEGLLYNGFSEEASSE